MSDNQSNQSKPQLPKTPHTIPDARLRARYLLPYIQKILMSMVPVEAPGIGTITCDKYMRLYYDPALLDRLSIDHLAAHILHNVMHRILKLETRMETAIGKDAHPLRQALFTLAQCIVINSNCLKKSGVKVPFDWPQIIGEDDAMGFLESLSDEDTPVNLLGTKHPIHFDDKALEKAGIGRNEATERYFQFLMDQIPPEMSGGGGGGSGQDADHQHGGSGGCALCDNPEGDRPWEQGPPSDESPGMSDFEQQMLERAVARDIKEQQKRRGNVPGELQRWADEILDPGIDPMREVEALVKYGITVAGGRGDYSYRVLPRRQPEGSFRMPGFVQIIPRVCVIIDSSGSMDKDDLGTALGVVNRTLRSLPQGHVEVVTGDTHSGDAQKVFAADQVRITGGGGTDMGAIVKDRCSKRPKADVVIVATDGYTPWCNEEDAQGSQVIAVIVNGDGSYGHRQYREEWPVPEWIKVVDCRGRGE